MSSESRPITAEAFAEALAALPLASVYSKALEIHNSMAHLQRSNAELKQFIDESPGGDGDCEEAIRENEGVIERMVVRLDLVKAELEGRGQMWVDVNGAPEAADAEAAASKEGESGVEEDQVGDVDDYPATTEIPASNVAAQPRSAQQNGDPEMSDAPNHENAGESSREERDANEAERGVYL